MGTNTPLTGPAQSFMDPPSGTAPMCMYVGGGTETVTITFTFTWVPNPTPPGKDPAPPTLAIVETGTAFWVAVPQNTDGPATGNCTDGIEDPEVDTNFPIGPYQTLYRGDSGGSVAKNMMVKSGVVTDTVTLTGSSTNQSATGAGWTFLVTAPTRAVPVNFHLYDPGSAPGDGTLVWDYVWDSSDGTHSDLTHYYVHEYTTYTSSPTGHFTYPAPFVATVPDPTITPKPAGQDDGAVPGITDTQYVPKTVAPYVSTSFSTTQYWEYDDLLSGKTNIRLSGPFTITRAVGPRKGYPGIWYSCTKNGLTGWHQLQ